MREAVLKIAALFSYCGGPLFIADVLKPRLKLGLAFLITFLPVGLMVLGAPCLDGDTRNRWSFASSVGRPPGSLHGPGHECLCPLVLRGRRSRARPVPPLPWHCRWGGVERCLLACGTSLGVVTRRLISHG